MERSLGGKKKMSIKIVLQALHKMVLCNVKYVEVTKLTVTQWRIHQ